MTQLHKKTKLFKTKQDNKMKQYTEEAIEKLVEKYNSIIKPQYKITDEWIIYLLGEAYEYNNLVKPFYKIPENETISGNVEVFRVA